MVTNILETGTPFDYKEEDFTKFSPKDTLFNNDPAIMVGERDIPDRDNRYIDKSFEDED